MSNRLAEYERQQLPEEAWWPAGGPPGDGLQQRVNGLFRQATRWIVEHPEIALTTAVVAGVVLGWMIKRR